ncbi:MAG: glycosyltransferase family 4 protein, partial [Armatimonadota bacterium]
MPNIILAISDIQKRKNGTGNAPLKDYERLSNISGATIEYALKHNDKPAAFRTIEKATALDLYQAIKIIKSHKNVDIIISFSEKIGIPISIFLKKHKNPVKHVMIAHKLDTKAKEILDKCFSWNKKIDKLLVICSSQLQKAKYFCGNRAELILAGVTDDEYFIPNKSETSNYVLSVGKENRDYNTLSIAARDINAQIKILADSPWARKNTNYTNLQISNNIEYLQRADYNKLLKLYQNAVCIVLPLNDASYAAGHNGLLESMCVGKATIVSNSKGISDYTNNDKAVIRVGIGDSSAIACQVNKIIENKDKRIEIEREARAYIENHLKQEQYCKKLQKIA